MKKDPTKLNKKLLRENALEIWKLLRSMISYDEYGCPRKSVSDFKTQVALIDDMNKKLHNGYIGTYTEDFKELMN